MLFVPGMLVLKPRKFVLLHSLGFMCGIFRCDLQCADHMAGETAEPKDIMATRNTTPLEPGLTCH